MNEHYTRSQGLLRPRIVLLTALTLLFVLFAGCVASKPIVNGLHQTKYWLDKGNTEKGKEVVNEMCQAVGEPTRKIDDTSHYPVIEEIRNYGNLLSMIFGAAGGFLGMSGGWEWLIGPTGVLAILVPLLLRERKKRKLAENNNEGKNGKKAKV